LSLEASVVAHTDDLAVLQDGRQDAANRRLVFFVLQGKTKTKTRTDGILKR
jgi:hypothetical protein